MLTCGLNTTLPVLNDEKTGFVHSIRNRMEYTLRSDKSDDGLCLVSLRCF